MVDMLNISKLRLAFWALVVAMALPGIASAVPVAWYQIGSGPINYITDFKNEEGNQFEFDFSETTGSYSIQGNILVQTDPFIAWGLAVLNNTDNPMVFSTGVLNTFFAPITTPNTVYGSISGSVTDIRGDGVSIAPVGTKIQTSTLNGFQNMGVDVGDFFQAGPGLPGQSYVTPPWEAGPQPGPIDTWTSMELLAQFTLSPRDIATLNGFASITPVPEPGTLLLLGTGLLGIAVWKRRKLF